MSGAMGAQMFEQFREAIEQQPAGAREVRDRMLSLASSGMFVLIVAAITIPAVRRLQHGRRAAGSGHLQEEDSALHRPTRRFTP